MSRIQEAVKSRSENIRLVFPARKLTSFEIESFLLSGLKDDDSARRNVYGLGAAVSAADISVLDLQGCFGKFRAVSDLHSIGKMVFGHAIGEYPGV